MIMFVINKFSQEMIKMQTMIKKERRLNTEWRAWQKQMRRSAVGEGIVKDTLFE
jgi:hypothetical protein